MFKLFSGRGFLHHFVRGVWRASAWVGAFVVLGANVASAAESCDLLTNLQIAQRCVAARETAPEIKIRTLINYGECRPKIRRRFWFDRREDLKLSARYGLAIVNSRVEITQRVRFLGVDKLTSKDEQAFRVLLEDLRRFAEKFFATKEVTYRFDYALTPKPRGKAGKRDIFTDEVLVQAVGERSNSAIWYLHNSKILPDGTYKKGTAVGLLDTWAGSSMALHELSHLMGLPDDYVDDDLACVSQYGKDGRNSERPFTVRDDVLGSRTEFNLMAEAGAGEVGTYPPDLFYALLKPLCPQLCHFDPQSKQMSETFLARADIEREVSQFKKELELFAPDYEISMVDGIVAKAKWSVASRFLTEMNPDLEAIGVWQKVLSEFEKRLPQNQKGQNDQPELWDIYDELKGRGRYFTVDNLSNSYDLSRAIEMLHEIEARLGPDTPTPILTGTPLAAAYDRLRGDSSRMTARRYWVMKTLTQILDDFGHPRD